VKRSGCGYPPTYASPASTIGIAGLKRIALTTVSQPLMLQAQRAATLPLERIERPTIATRHVRVPVELRSQRQHDPAEALERISPEIARRALQAAVKAL